MWSLKQFFPLLFLLTHNQLSFSIYFAGTEQEQQEAVTGRQADRHHSLQYNKLLKADEAANAGTYTHAVTDLHSDGVRDDNGVGVSGSVLKVWSCSCWVWVWGMLLLLLVFRLTDTHVMIFWIKKKKKTHLSDEHWLCVFVSVSVWTYDNKNLKHQKNKINFKIGGCGLRSLIFETDVSYFGWPVFWALRRFSVPFTHSTTQKLYEL